LRSHIHGGIGVATTCANEHDTDAAEYNANSAQLVDTAAGSIDVAQADLDLANTPYCSGRRGAKTTLRMDPEGIRNRDVSCDSYIHQISFR
jgi:hypothetical protein